MKNIMESSSPLMNMRFFNKGHIQEIYSRLLIKFTISLLTLKLILHYDAKLQRQVQFDFEGTQNCFEEVQKYEPTRSTNDKKLNNIRQAIMWEPCDGNAYCTCTKSQPKTYVNTYSHISPIKYNNGY